MAANVTVHHTVHGDPRYHALAALLGCNHFEAIGRMVALWSTCTDIASDTPPLGHVIGCLGINGPTALVDAGLGEAVDGGLVRVRGCAKRIGWLQRKREVGAMGGKATQAKGKKAKKSARPVVDACSTGAQAPLEHVLEHELEHQSSTTQASAKASGTQVLRDPGTKEELPGKPAPVLALVSPEPSGHQAVVAAFDSAFRAQTGAAPTWGAKQGAQVRELVAKHSAAEVQRRIGVLFSAPPPWLAPPFDLGTLVQHFDKLAAPSKPPPSKTPAAPPRRIERL